MEHVVFHSGPDGTPAFRRFGALEEAVRFVEHLRNVEGVVDAEVHVLTPVPLAFRAYYKVELPSVEMLAVPTQASDAEPLELAPVDVAPEPMPEPMPEATPEPDQPVAASGKKTLGFFAG